MFRISILFLLVFSATLFARGGMDEGYPPHENDEDYLPPSRMERFEVPGTRVIVPEARARDQIDDDVRMMPDESDAIVPE